MATMNDIEMQMEDMDIENEENEELVFGDEIRKKRTDLICVLWDAS